MIPEDLESFATAVGPDADDVQREMHERAVETGFPTVGPAVGGWLYLLSRLVDARRVFEFGSGFGYSAYWIARALPADGEVVLTEVDADELDSAREYLRRGGYVDRARFEDGDALETIERYDGPFDVVLIDNEKHRYEEAFTAVRQSVPTGGVVCADNAVTADHIEFGALRRLLEGADVETTTATRGIATYLETVREDPAFETVLLPLGEGLAVSRRISE